MAAPFEVGLDQVRLTELPFVPEVRLYLAADAIILWARLEAEAGRALPPPYWASAWVGGQALARYVLDHPQTVCGLRVLDLAAGCGQAGIAAALAGAASVEANDTDPYAHRAIALNARTNGVVVAVSETDLLDGAGADADVVLAGDVFYSKDMAERMRQFMQRVASRGATVLVGDPGRAFLPHDWLQRLTTYQVPTAGGIENTEIKQTHVLRPRTKRMGSPDA
ncbi:MAG TPA: 50S ribosomal protein L11 methyltransferase [Micromonosporaceae bacterium]|nr:50S ribosomal protein L11 methyltransferase [Micromonosporaceae bacterium]